MSNRKDELAPIEQTAIESKGDGRDLITNSRAQCFKLCPRKHYYSYVCGVRREQSAALRFGGAFHEALHLYKTTEDIDRATSFLDDNYRAMIDATDSEERIESLLLELVKVKVLLQGYIIRWADEPIEILESEIQFDLPIVNPQTEKASRTYRNAGKIDAVAHYDGRLVILEHKTTGDSITTDSNYWDRLALDEQISRYILAARELGYDVGGVLYDVIRKPSIAPKLVGRGEDRRRESLVEYSERLSEDIGTRPSFYFARREVVRFERELTEMRYEMWDIAKQIRQAERNNLHYKNSQSCRFPYPCAYLPLCVNQIDVENEALPEGFERVQNVNPELGETDDANSTTTAAAKISASTNTC